MTENRGGWNAYIDAVLRIEAPCGVIWVRPAPLSRTSGDYPEPDGRAICVITAHNPGGRLVSGVENAAAQAHLVAELEERELTWWPAAGGDPSWRHVEESAAVIGMDEADAMALGAQFGQEAIFVLTTRDRQVVGCAERRIAATGWSIEPEADLDEAITPVDEPGSLAGTVILVDVSDLGDEDERLYVIPESWARSELRSYATLRFALSYRDVLADDAAVQTVVAALGPMLEDLDENLNERELFDQRVAEDAPFDAEAVFGSEGWRQWTPSAEQSSARFAEVCAPALWSRFRQTDGGWGIDYDPTDYLAAPDQEQILAELRVLGCEILHCPGLVRQYGDTDADLVVRIDAGEWPPRPANSEPPGKSSPSADRHLGLRRDPRLCRRSATTPNPGARAGARTNGLSRSGPNRISSDEQPRYEAG